MPSDPKIIERLTLALDGRPGVIPKRMFGGVCFMLNGNMFCGVYKSNIIIRVGEERARALLGQPHVRAMDITGRPMKGWAQIEPSGFPDAATLVPFLEATIAFVSTLPRK